MAGKLPRHSFLPFLPFSSLEVCMVLGKRKRVKGRRGERARGRNFPTLKGRCPPRPLPPPPPQSPSQLWPFTLHLILERGADAWMRTCCTYLYTVAKKGKIPHVASCRWNSSRGEKNLPATPRLRELSVTASGGKRFAQEFEVRQEKLDVLLETSDPVREGPLKERTRPLD